MTTTMERIKASVIITEDGCWMWQKATQNNGYGKFALGGGRTVGAHRASFEAFIGPIPAGVDVCHRCDVRACVNPEHLFLGSRSDNIRDAVAKGRFNRTARVRGSQHPSAKLTETDAEDILRAIAAGQTCASLGARYGVSPGLISHIKCGRSWRHVRRRFKEQAAA